MLCQVSLVVTVFAYVQQIVNRQEERGIRAILIPADYVFEARTALTSLSSGRGFLRSAARTLLCDFNWLPLYAFRTPAFWKS